MQDRRGVLVSIGLALGALGMSLSGGSQAQQFKFTLADPYAPTELLGENMKAWGDDIRKATNGGLEIQMHFTGTLFKAAEIRRAVQTGQIEMGSQLMSSLGPEKRLFEMDGLPFLTRSYDEVKKLWDLQRPYVASYLQKQGIRVLYAAPWPSQAFFFKKEIQSLADVKGLRQRSGNEIQARLAQLMGAIPTTVQVPEIPQAMVTGTIQAFPLSSTSAVLMKLWEVSSHYYDDYAYLPKQMVFVSESAFAKLPPKFQQIVVDSARSAEQRGFALSQEHVQAAHRKLNEMGMKGGKPSPTLLKELHQVGDTMLAEWLQKADDDAKAVLTQYRKAVGR